MEQGSKPSGAQTSLSRSFLLRQRRNSLKRWASCVPALASGSLPTRNRDLGHSQQPVLGSPDLKAYFLSLPQADCSVVKTGNLIGEYFEEKDSLDSLET